MTNPARITLEGIPDLGAAVPIELSAYLALKSAGWRPPVYAPANESGCA